MSAKTSKTPPRVRVSWEPDPNESFPYGWRCVPETLPDGKVIYHDVPLTLEDFLYPKLYDEMPESTTHSRLRADLFGIFDNRYADDPTIGVFSLLKMKWGISVIGYRYLMITGTEN